MLAVCLQNTFYFISKQTADLQKKILNTKWLACQDERLEVHSFSVLSTVMNLQAKTKSWHISLIIFKSTALFVKSFTGSTRASSRIVQIRFQLSDITQLIKSAVCLQNTFELVDSLPLAVQNNYVPLIVHLDEPVIWYFPKKKLCQLFFYL